MNIYRKIKIMKNIILYFTGIISLIAINSCDFRAITTEETIPIDGRLNIDNVGTFNESTIITSARIEEELDIGVDGFITALQIVSIKLKADFNIANEATSFRAVGTINIKGIDYELFSEQQFAVSENDTINYPLQNLNPVAVGKLRDYVAYVYNYTNGFSGFEENPGDMGVNIQGYPVLPNQDAKFIAQLYLVINFSAGFRGCYQVPIFMGDECQDTDPLYFPGWF